jgi:hypothetical protein
MEKHSIFRFFARKPLPVTSVPESPFSEQSRSQHFFFADLRSPSNQLQVVAMPLGFGRTGAVRLMGVY